MVIIDIFQTLRNRTNQKHTWGEGRRFLKKLTVVYIRKRKISILQKKKKQKKQNKKNQKHKAIYWIWLMINYENILTRIIQQNYKINYDIIMS